MADHRLSLRCLGITAATTRLYWNWSATPTCYRRLTMRGLSALKPLKGNCGVRVSVSPGFGFAPPPLRPGAGRGTCPPISGRA
jgi:hypothetical protein